MVSAKKLAVWLGIGLVLGLSACSSGKSGGGITVSSATQDLTVDPDGETTVIQFSAPVSGMLTPGQFEADGGQLATAVTVAGDTATVTWDERVTPSHQVRAVGISGVVSAFVPVVTTDATPPTFVVTGGTQTAGLGGDSFSVQFNGVRVVEALAEDLASWELSIDGTSLDLTGSTLALDPTTQVLDVTLGTGANLHASFDLRSTGVLSVADVPVATAAVMGSATGDADPPTLLSSEQNLAESEYGFVVDFTFDEAMDPVFNTGGVFSAGFPVFASLVEQPSEDVLRVTFTAPIIPGQDTVDLSGVVDAHGNAAPSGPVAITAGSTVANGYAAGGPTVTTVENFGGDTVSVQFVQAIDPDTADDFATWSLESPGGNPIDLTNATFDYDFLAKSLTITLTDVDLTTGAGFDFAPAGGPFPVDVDGEDFTAAFAGVVVGDVAVPTVVAVTQNRLFDSSGMTFDVAFSEDVSEVPAETTGNYAFDSGATVLSATLLAGRDTVRVVVDARTTPGEHLVDVQGMFDLAGNAMGVEAGLALGSTDGVAPGIAQLDVFAETGAENDTLTVAFDDDMIPTDVTDPASWNVESPLGSPLDTSLATITYDAPSRRAVLTFDGGSGVNLKRDDSVSLMLDTMRDVAGNVVDPAPTVGTVAAESDFPELEAVWVEAGNPQNVHVRFSEPAELFGDALTRYVVRDASGLDVGGGTPTALDDADGRGATLTFAVGVVAGVHTLDVRGVTDLAGNQMFPRELVAIEAEDTAEPALDPGLQLYLAVSGEDNDTLDVVFDRAVSTWGLFDPTMYTLTNGGSMADFTAARFDFDGDRTLSVTFEGGMAFDNAPYTLTVDGMVSAQGETMSMASVEMATADAGTDVQPAALVPGRTRLDAADPASSVLVEFDEAVSGAEAVDPLNYEIGGVNPDTVASLGSRTARATWLGGVTPGQVVDVTVADLAGNAGLVSEAIQAADTNGPAVLSVAGVVTPGVGGDRIEVAYSEPVDLSTAMNRLAYTVTAGGVAVDTVGATLRYTSATNTVSIHLPDSVALQEVDTLNVQVTGVLNMAGITMSPAANVNGPIGGDGTAPGFRDAYLDYRADASGSVVMLRFDEDVDASFVTDPLSFTSTGGQVVTDAVLVRPDTVRLTFSSPLGVGHTVEATGVPDLAGNLSGLLSMEPAP